MAYQDLYGTCWDDQVGNGHTSSLRGKVTSVGLDCNTRYGSCIRVDINHIDGKDEVSKPDLRKVKKEDRKAVSDKYLKDVSDSTNEIVSIYLQDNSHFKYKINGYEIKNIADLRKNLTALSNPQVIQFIKDLELIDQI